MSKSASSLKKFDCVAMKRRIQEKIYAETRGMSPDELLSYFHQRVAASRFAPFFGLKPDAQPYPRAGNKAARMEQ